MRRSFLLGVGMGAVLMYFFDPSWGRRRRAQLRERLEAGARRVETWRDQAEARRRLEEEMEEDEVIEQDDMQEEAEIDWMGARRPDPARDD